MHQGDDDDGKGLVEMVMELLGIDPNSIGEDDNLAGMGIDSMQVVEVRARIQRALGRPIPLEEVRYNTCLPRLHLAQVVALDRVVKCLGRPSTGGCNPPWLKTKVKTVT